VFLTILRFLRRNAKSWKGELLLHRQDRFAFICSHCRRFQSHRFQFGSAIANFLILSFAFDAF